MFLTGLRRAAVTALVLVSGTGTLPSFLQRVAPRVRQPPFQAMGWLGLPWGA